MPYPFAQAPTTARLIEIVTGERFGAELRTTSAIVGPRGEVRPRYLRRETGGTVLTTEPLPDDDDQRVGWDLLRRVCAQLRIDPADLELPGLHLG